MSRVAAGLGAALLAWASIGLAAPPAKAKATPAPTKVAQGPKAAGEVTMLIGEGTALTPEGDVRPLAKGERVYSGEIINTAPNSYLNLKFTDGGLTLLRPNTRFEITEYVHVGGPKEAATKVTKSEAKDAAFAPATTASPDPTATTAPRALSSATDKVLPPASAGSRAFFRLLRGGLRTVTGAIGKGESQYRMRTPTATIGVRGTEYYVVFCDAACAASDPTLQNGAGGVVVGVIEGGVFVANDAGDSMDVGENEYSLTLPDGTQVKLPYEPRFVTLDPIPDPEACD